MDYGPCGWLAVLDWDAAGTYGILDGQAPTRLLPVLLHDPSWSPAGDRLAFEHGLNIFTIVFESGTFDTLGVTQLTSDGNSLGPRWSPDGSMIAYVRLGCDESYPLSDLAFRCIVVMTPSGDETRALVSGGYPSWFPDSRRLLYSGLWDDLFVYDLDDGTTTQLTDFGSHSVNNYSLAVAPNGALIAFASQRSNSPVNIWIVKADGSGLRRLTSEGTLSTFTWGADSEHVLYVNYKADDYTENNGSLWLINVHSGEKRRIVHGSLEK